MKYTYTVIVLLLFSYCYTLIITLALLLSYCCSLTVILALLYSYCYNRTVTLVRYNNAYHQVKHLRSHISRYMVTAHRHYDNEEEEEEEEDESFLPGLKDLAYAGTTRHTLSIPLCLSLPLSMPL